MKFEISVLMPVYNSEKYVSAAIRSILNQTFRDFELLILNDGSTDDSEKIIKEFDDSRIVYLVNPVNLGLALTRNRLIENARGNYLAIMDSDDLSFPSRLERQLKFLKRNPAFGVVGTSCIIIDKNDKRIGKIHHSTRADRIPSILFFKNYFVQSSVMIRSSILPLSPYDPKLPPVEDYGLWIRLSKVTRMFSLTESLIKYRVHGGNISITRKDLLKTNLRTVLSEQITRLQITPTEEELEIQLNLTEPSPAFEMAEISDWLLKVKIANDNLRVFSVKAFNEIVFDTIINHVNQRNLYTLSSIAVALRRETLPGLFQIRFSSIVGILGKTFIWSIKSFFDRLMFGFTRNDQP